ncbi:cache domain-containing protein [Polymorphum gilvum]|uniref:cache domain-containing protein n=1 Tax=Polymorphum gilvum TaxID=991904 RepID=UPI00059E7BDB|nr:cache domain-containing protein [Polymorphum gilvum]
MTFKTKLFVITVLPLVAVSILVGAITAFQASRLIEVQTSTVEQRILASKRQELQNTVALALTSIKILYDHEPGGRQAAQEEAKRILHDVTFGEDGYFFVYLRDGTNIVHPKLPHLVGNKWWDLQDPKGDFVIRNLMLAAQSGGGFHRYIWDKPSIGVEAEKLGYAVMLDKWDWMLGTGLYIDDIAQQVDAIRADFTANVRQTLLVIFLITMVAILLILSAVATVSFSEQKFADGKLKELTHRIVDIQEQERKRVSSELHDSISQLLVSVRYGIEMIHSKAAGTLDLQRQAENCLRILDDAISEVRRISKDLRPSVLDDMGLAAALVSLAKDFESQSGITVRVSTERCRARLSDSAKTGLYRVVQEALTNVAKHAAADEVRIALSAGVKDLTLSIEDNGVGLPSPIPTANGLGIRNMLERVETHGGTMTMSRLPLGGTAIRVTMPLATSNGPVEAA